MDFPFYNDSRPLIIGANKESDQIKNAAATGDFPPLPKIIAFFWTLECFSVIFALTIPGIGLATTTVFSVPCVGYAFIYLNEFRNRRLTIILWLIAVGVIVSGIAGGNLEAVYLNFLFWVVNAAASYKLLVHPQGRKIAISAWAWALLLFAAGRILNIFGFINASMFNRNGCGFFLSIFLVPCYLHFRSKIPRGCVNTLLICLLVLLLLNASRSGILSSFLAIMFMLFYFQKTIGTFLKIIPVFLTITLLSTAFSSYLISYSPYLANFVEWIEEYAETGDFDTFQRGGGASMLLREGLARKSYDLIQRHPVSGVGLYRWDKTKNVPSQLFLDRIRLQGIREHNTYLSWMAETGLLGTVPLVLFVIFLLNCIWRSRHLYIQEPDENLVIGACITLIVLFDLNFVANLTAGGTWIMLIAVVAFNDSHQRFGLNETRVLSPEPV